MESEQLVNLFTRIERIKELRGRQRELDLDVKGVFGFLWLATIDVPTISTMHGFVLTGVDAATATAPGTATEALEKLELTYKDKQVHPLQPWVQYAGSRYDHVRQHMRDHTCVLIKRERIDGLLSEHQYLLAKSRCEQVRNEKIVAPLSIYLHYLGPASVKGRKVLFVDGQNDDKMLVRKGGQRFSFVKVKIDPHGDAAMRESRYPITELGIDNVIKRLLERANQDMSADPQGQNTRVDYFREAQINKRSCIHIRVVHARHEEGLSFHRAEIYVDDELQVPIRIEAYDWPQQEGGEPELLEEFTYTNLKVNVGLKPADFLPQQLD